MTDIDLRAHGVRGDGQTNDTKAFHAAFAAVAAAGGGRVRVPTGRYLVAGLTPVSRLRLELDPGAVLVGSPRMEDYPATNIQHGDITPYHVINAQGCEDLTIAGGKITGNGAAYWLPPDHPGGWMRHNNPYRPSPMVDLRGCRNLRLEGVHLDDSAGWTLHLHECEGVIVDGCVITTDPAGPNTDGIDISGSRDVLIRSCRIQCGDDAIVVFPSKTRDCEGVVVDGCVVESLCVAFKAYNQSDLPGAVRDLSFSRCVVRGTNRVLGVYSHRGGPIERVTMSDVLADTDCCMVSTRPIHLDARPNNNDASLPPGGIRHVRVRGLHCRTDGRILLTAAGGAYVSDVLLEDITLEYPRIADPSIVPNKPNYGSAQDSNLSFEARRFPAALVADGIEDLVVRGLKLRYAMHENRPWKIGPRRGNGYHEIFPALTPPAAFHPWWIRGAVSLCPSSLANRGPNGEAGVKG
jgi:hypothetical protein